MFMKNLDKNAVRGYGLIRSWPFSNLESILSELMVLDTLKIQLSYVLGSDAAVDFMEKSFAEAIQLPGRNYDYMINKMQEKINEVISTNCKGPETDNK